MSPVVFWPHRSSGKRGALTCVSLLMLQQAACDAITCVDTATCTYPERDAAGSMPVEAGEAAPTDTVQTVVVAPDSKEAGPVSVETHVDQAPDSAFAHSANDAGEPTQSADAAEGTESPGVEPTNATATSNQHTDASSPHTDGASSGCADDCCESPLTACGDSCVNLKTDGSNCGTCGRDCLGQACTDAQCAPATIGTLENGSGDLTIQGGFLYSLGDQDIEQVSTMGGSATRVGWSQQDIERIVTDERYHYSFYFNSQLTIGRSPLVAIPMGSTFENLTEPTASPREVTAFDSNTTHLYLVGGTTTKEVYVVPKTGGELSRISGSENLYLDAFAVDEQWVFGMGRKTISRLPVGGGLVLPVAAAAAEETFEGIALTADSVVVYSDMRIAVASKEGTSLETLTELPSISLLESDRGGSSIVFVQSLGNVGDCDDGAAIFESTLPGAPVKLATLDRGCVDDLVFDDEAVYWVDGRDVLKVTRHLGRP
jgi:hypothetical protein